MTFDHRVVRVIQANPDFRSGECALKFTLTYEGAVNTGSGHADKKHDRRREFHQQLKHLWAHDPLLKEWEFPSKDGMAPPTPAPDFLKDIYQKGKFNFVPIVSRYICVEAALNLRILRPSIFKGEQADVDNIIKAVVDSLTAPPDLGHLPKGNEPEEGEDPFFVLLEDDCLVTKVTATIDELLQPLNGRGEISKSDTRIFAEVCVRPNFPKNSNVIFFSDDVKVWEHRWAEGVYDSIQGWPNAELKARTAQCVLRLRALADSFRMDGARQRKIMPRDAEGVEEYLKESSEKSAKEYEIWDGGLRPVAMAFRDELLRRIHGEPPHPTDNRFLALYTGLLSGIPGRPMSEVADGLESLIRQLP